MSAVVLRLAGKAPIRVVPDLEPGVNPMLVFDAVKNLVEEVRDVERITRIVRFRVERLEDLSRWTEFPENAERFRKRADAYRCWLFHLELMTASDDG